MPHLEITSSELLQTSELIDRYTALHQKMFPSGFGIAPQDLDLTSLEYDPEHEAMMEFNSSIELEELHDHLLSLSPRALRELTAIIHTGNGNFAAKDFWREVEGLEHHQSHEDAVSYLTTRPSMLRHLGNGFDLLNGAKVI
jgi:Protein of unknown function (DUF3775)